MKERITGWAERFIRLPVLGLDISDRSIKYMKFSAGRMVKIEFFGEEQIPEGVIIGGQVEREEELTAVIRGLADSVGRRFRSAGAVVSLPEEKSFLRLVELPKVKSEEVVGAMRWQIEGQIPLPPDDIAYDFEMIDPLLNHLDHLDAVITAFPRRLVDSYVRVLKNAGLRLAAMELESQAIVRAAVREVRSREAKIIVDMGRYRTSFVIFVGGTIIFTATLPVGGRVFEAQISKTLGVEGDEAMRIKKEIGLSRGAYEGKVFGALLPALGRLAAELVQAVAYYKDHVSHIHGASEGINLILLSGGDANLYGLDTYLASAIRIPVQIADPFSVIGERLGYVVPPIPRNEALAFSAAIGLAMRGL